MSSAFSKSKGKRSRSSSNEANYSSFIKNVTSRMSELLPATIRKWFSSCSSSNTNGSVPMADSDSSTDDEPSTSQPPSKRMRFSTNDTPGNFTSSYYYSFSEPSQVNSVTEKKMYEVMDTVEPCGSCSTAQFPSETNTLRKETPFPPTERKQTEKEKDNSSYKTHTVSKIGQSIERKRNSLFLSDSLPSPKETSPNASDIIEYNIPQPSTSAGVDDVIPDNTTDMRQEHGAACEMTRAADSPHMVTFTQEDAAPPAIANCIIVGSKPATDCIIVGSRPNASPSIDYQHYTSAYVPLVDCAQYLRDSRTYCGDCRTLFPTVNALDAHYIHAHSCLVARKSSRRRRMRKS